MSDKKARILFVEDDTSLALVTQDSLELQDYEIVHCADGEAALERYQREQFDLCLLDVMLPKLDGFSLAEKIREQNHDIPIIFLTAKSMKEDKITGLKIGADDYLTKPFSIEELILKIEVFLRRSRFSESENTQSEYKIGTFIFNFDELLLNNTKAKNADDPTRKLTLREAEVLRLFCQNLNKILKREYILKKIWGENDYFMGRSLDVFITRLRKYLKADENIKIENIPSVGFKLIIQ